MRNWSLQSFNKDYDLACTLPMLCMLVLYINKTTHYQLDYGNFNFSQHCDLAFLANHVTYIHNWPLQPELKVSVCPIWELWKCLRFHERWPEKCMKFSTSFQTLCRTICHRRSGFLHDGYNVMPSTWKQITWNCTVCYNKYAESRIEMAIYSI